MFFSLSTRDGKLEVSRSIARTFLPTPRISLSLSFRLGRRLLRARARYMHRHIHRFDSMRAFDFNKSALELSFLVVARGFVFSWVSCCLSSLSLSLSARRAYARAAGRYSEKAKFNPFCFCRGTKIVTFRHTDRVKKTNNSLTSSARASVRSLRKTTGTISPRVLLSSSSPESSIFCSSSSRARQTSRLGSFSLTRFARGRGERHLGILSLSLSLSLSRPNRTNERTNERAKEREREFSL